MKWVALLAGLSLLLSGCSLYDTGPELDEHGCTKKEGWCPSLEECLEPWNSYCPEEGESVNLVTADDCRAKGGHAVDYGAGLRCGEDESVQGEVAGLLSLHVCCVSG
ncbi:hypothetical protein KY327_01485 [Candidatus Woesearchaeota archaeon]|nr:hypothetical protein [Candidatus Woesearchaeota archaeon]